MTTLHLILAFLIQGYLCTWNGGKVPRSASGWWGGPPVNPALALSSFTGPKYLPYFSTSTSQVPVFKSYFKPVIKSRFKKIPVRQNKIDAILSRLPCLKKKFLWQNPGAIALLPSLKASCLKPSLWRPPCSPYSTFC